MASKSAATFVNHLGLVRGAFSGSGNLTVTALSWEHKDFEICPVITLEDPSDEYVESLGNFKKQKIQVEFAVEEIDEWFNVSDVVTFIRPVESGYPT